jgi:hypothetical protein
MAQSVAGADSFQSPTSTRFTRLQLDLVAADFNFALRLSCVSSSVSQTLVLVVYTGSGHQKTRNEDETQERTTRQVHFSFCIS